jgi:DNA-3-methyladenine glycosylase I
MHRCAWAGDDPLMQAYHDEEWGYPERDSQALWGKLVLDGFQAGLSWRTILHRREGFRAAFHGFDPEQIAAYGEADVARLMADPGIIRSRSKIEAAIGNARAYLAMRDAGHDFSAFCWGFVGGEPIRNHYGPGDKIPAQTPLSEQVSKALRNHGFKFVGPVIVYAWMQAVGLVDDHVESCFRRTHPRPAANGEALVELHVGESRRG